MAYILMAYIGDCQGFEKVVPAEKLTAQTDKRQDEMKEGSWSLRTLQARNMIKLCFRKYVLPFKKKEGYL